MKNTERGFEIVPFEHLKGNLPFKFKINIKSIVENNGSDQNQQKVLKKNRQECIVVER